MTLALESEVGIPATPVTVSGRLGTMGRIFSSRERTTISMNGNWLSLWGNYAFPVTEATRFGLVFGASQSWFYDLVPIPFRSVYSRPQPMVMFAGAAFQHHWNEVWGLSRLSLSVTPSVAIPVTYRSSAYPAFDFFEAGMLGPALLEVSASFKNGTVFKLRPSITPVSLSFSF